MKIILTAIVKTLLAMLLISLIGGIAIVILTIIIPDNAEQAFEILKGLLP